jgi:hypothetical protein
VSLRGGQLCSARWDLDEIERTDDWILILPDASQALSLPGVDKLLEFGHGTVVIWEQLDRATAGDASPGEALQKQFLDCGDYLSLVFHRYISPETGRRLTLTLNGRALEAADPFMLKNPYTEFAGEESYLIDGKKIRARAYILPHIGKMHPEELERAGGKQRLRDMQGFYIYRNRRLITYGTWFRLASRDELTRLARIQIDIPNDLDHLWRLDVKKSAATPPESVRELLRHVIRVVAVKSENVFKERRRRGVADTVITYLWERTKARSGVRFDINRGNPLVESFVESLTTIQYQQFERLLSAIELALPVRQIYIDQAGNEAVDQSPDTGDRLAELLTDLTSGLDSERRQKLIEDLLNIEPFKNYPQLTRSLVELSK